MYTVLIISIIIVIIVLVLSVVTTSKAYQYKHTVDPLNGNPDLPEFKKSEDKTHHDEKNN